jgi:GT2 family glycosyltransferase
MAPPAAEGPGWISGTSWLSDGLLVMVGWFPSDGDTHEGEAAIARASGEIVPARWTSVIAGSRAEGRRSEVKLAVARFPESARARGEVGALLIDTSDGPGVVPPGDLSQVLTDLKTLMREDLAWLDADSRAAVIQFLAQTVAVDGADYEASQSLFRIREALRERLPISVTSSDCPLALHVDVFVRMDERSFYVQGWLRNRDAEPVTLVAISAEGHRIEVLEGAFRHSRPDVASVFGLRPEGERELRSGFVSHFEVEGPSRIDDGWIFELRGPRSGVEVVAPSPIGDPRAAREVILRAVDLERLPAEDLRIRHIMPAMTRVQRRLDEEASIAGITEYGDVPEAPEVSIIIPLYRRLEFLEQQLAQFVHDPEVMASDLLYVLDSPEDEDYLRLLAEQLFRLYRVPFRIAILNQNSGFSRVNNLGASVARGRLILFMNSDVLPDRPGWLGKMAAFYDSTPRIGALGPKLLYEDGSLQHAGLYFDRPLGGHVWSNEHFFKGLHRSFPAANVARPVPAVTGACLMISAELYRSLGGLRGVYVQGDYEDSDLCLRLAELGLDRWFYPDVELYHLEGQSYALADRRPTTEYNAWLHTHLWKEQIESLASSPLNSQMRWETAREL